MNDNHDEKGRFASGPGGGAHPGDRGSLGHTRAERIKHYEGLGHSPESARARMEKDAAREATGGKPHPAGYRSDEHNADNSRKDERPHNPKAPHEAHPKEGGKDPHPFKDARKTEAGKELRRAQRASIRENSGTSTAGLRSTMTDRRVVDGDVHGEPAHNWGSAKSPFKSGGNWASGAHSMPKAPSRSKK